MFVKVNETITKLINGRLYVFGKDKTYYVPEEIGNNLCREEIVYNSTLVHDNRPKHMADKLTPEEINGPYTDYVRNPPFYDIENKENQFYVIKQTSIMIGRADFLACKPGDIISLKNHKARPFLQNNQIIELSKLESLIQKLNSETLEEYDSKIREYQK